MRTFVLDTSVLLADPAALTKFDEHDVVVPLVVLTELEAKRQHPELGWSAREALRSLERLRVQCGTLTDPIPVNDRGGRVRVELNHIDSSSLPEAFSSSVNDHRILAVARNLADKGVDVVLVTKDLPLRLKAAVVGLEADEYRHEMVDADGWSGLQELDVEADLVDRLYHDRSVVLDDGGSLPVNVGLVLRSSGGSALARQRADGRAHLVDGDRHLFDVRGRSAEQRVALDLLADESGRHRVAGRAGRHRQVGAGPGRRVGGGAGAPDPPQGDRVPTPVRGRRPGARLPAGQRDREDEPVGGRGHRRAGGHRRARGDRGGGASASWWRCCRSPTSGAGR